MCLSVSVLPQFFRKLGPDHVSFPAIPTDGRPNPARNEGKISPLFYSPTLLRFG
jgi:hypothetical protein